MIQQGVDHFCSDQEDCGLESEQIKIYESLQRLIGLHRKLLEAVRIEKNALVQADMQEILKITALKQSLIEEIHLEEAARMKLMIALALQLKRPLNELTLPNIIIEIQGRDPKMADQFRSAYNALTILIQRITDQNSFSMALIEKSLVHIKNMKRNILEVAEPQATTYSHQGQKVNSASPSRILSRKG